MSVELKINGFNDYLERVQRMGKNVDAIAEDCLQQSANRVTAELQQGIRKHKQTGNTEQALIKSPRVTRSGGKLSVRVGFKLPEGLPARYINRGTPTVKPDPFINRALSKKKLKDEQERYFEKIINS